MDNIVVPPTNGSRGLVEVGSFVERTLRDHGADVAVQQFTATPYGMQLVFAAAALLAVGSASATLRARDGLALVLSVAATAVLVTEMVAPARRATRGTRREGTDDRHARLPDRRGGTRARVLASREDARLHPPGPETAVIRPVTAGTGSGA